MELTDLAKLATQGGIAVLALLLLGKVVLRVGERMIAAIDKLVAKVDEHTATDIEHHGEVKQAIVRVEGKIDGVLDERERTPVNVPIPQKRARTHPGGAGGYRGVAGKDDKER
jgi:hypothetical protein